MEGRISLRILNRQEPKILLVYSGNPSPQVVMTSESMKISIITVCFNSADTIEVTIESVLSQSYKDIEYIIVDGGSTDGTIGVIDTMIN